MLFSLRFHLRIRNLVSYLGQRKGKAGKYTGHARNRSSVHIHVEHTVVPSHRGKENFVQVQPRSIPVRQLFQEQEHLLTPS